MNAAVAEMDKVTQQNAASAEESASAASELSGQSEELAAMVAIFQLGQTGRPGETPRVAPRPAAAKLSGSSGSPSRARVNGKALGKAFPMGDHETSDF